MLENKSARVDTLASPFFSLANRSDEIWSRGNGANSFAFRKRNTPPGTRGWSTTNFGIFSARGFIRVARLREMAANGTRGCRVTSIARRLCSTTTIPGCTRKIAIIVSSVATGMLVLLAESVRSDCFGTMHVKVTDISSWSNKNFPKIVRVQVTRKSVLHFPIERCTFASRGSTTEWRTRVRKIEIYDLSRARSTHFGNRVSRQ